MMNNYLSKIISVVFCFSIFACSNGTNSTKSNPNVPQTIMNTGKSQGYHDPLQIGYAADIEKTTEIIRAEELIAKYKEKCGLTEQRLEGGSKILLKHMVTSSGAIKIKNQAEKQLYLDYCKNSMLILNTLKYCHDNQIINQDELGTLAKSYSNFVITYYNKKHGLNIPLAQ